MPEKTEFNSNKFWRTYPLVADNDMGFRSAAMESDSSEWEILSTQVFEFKGELFISVLWDTFGNDRP